MDFDFNSILGRIRDRLQSPGSQMEGTWSMDNAQAVAQELAAMDAMEIEVIPNRVLLDTAEGEFLDRRGLDYAEPRLEGESDSAYRDRLLQKIRNPITSGNRNHYVYWAKQVQGVGDAKCVERWDGPGTVKVVILSDTSDVPTDEVVAAVQAHIEEERPVCVEVTVAKAQPLDVVIDITVAMEDGYSLEDLQRAIEDDIRSYLSGIAFSGAQLSYYRVGDRIFNADGVGDIIAYTINGGTVSLSTNYEQFFRLQEVSVHVAAR